MCACCYRKAFTWNFVPAHHNSIAYSKTDLKKETEDNHSVRNQCTIRMILKLRLQGKKQIWQLLLSILFIVEQLLWLIASAASLYHKMTNVWLIQHIIIHISHAQSKNTVLKKYCTTDWWKRPWNWYANTKIKIQT